MKLIAAAVLVGALIIATAIVATRSTAEAPPVSDGPTIESACGMAGGFWTDGPTDDPFDGTCTMP